MPSNTNTVRAADFTQSIGVNTHISWKGGGSSYANAGVIQRSLAYLGVSHVRDGVPFENFTLSEYVALAQTGIKFNLLVSGPNLDLPTDLTRMGRLASAVPGAVASIEGVNEFNTNDVTVDGVASRGNPAWAQVFGPKLWAAVKADPVLANVPVIAASLASSGAADVAKHGNVGAFTDSANWHTYFGQGDQPAQQVATNVALAQSTSPGEKVTMTETGYYTAVDAMDWGGGGVTPAVQAIMTVNVLLDGYKNGVAKTYIYELLDARPGPSSTDLENSFGLFQGDGTPKPAATAVHNLTTILADKGAAASTFSTGTLNMTVTGLPPTGSTMTMQKSDGSFDVVVWDEPDIWNQPTKSAIDPAPKPVTVQLGGTYGTVKVYDPLTGTAPTRTLANVDKVELSLGSHPYIIEVPAGPASAVAAAAAVPAVTAPAPVAPTPVTPAPVAPAPVTIGSGADTLALSVSGDAWQGEAQFTVSVDGKQVGGTQTALASHGAGQVQAFNVKGDFAAGAHTAKVSFTNDASGGSPGQDRNLHLQAASYNGATLPVNPTTLYGPAPVSFGFIDGAAATPSGAGSVTVGAGPDALVLKVSQDAFQGNAQYTVKVDGAQIGGTLTAQALHGSGLSDTVTVLGNFAKGDHTATVNFTNDAWNGTPTGDRNLWLEGATYNGAAVPNATAYLYGNPPAAFSFTDATA